MLRRFIGAVPRALRRQKLLSALCRLRVIAPTQLAEFNGGAKAWVDLRDAEARATYLSQSFWPEFPPMVAAFLRAGGDLFDVGAHFGLVTFGTVPLVRGAGIGFHLFEANALTLPALGRSAGEWPGETFRINHCCVTDQAGTSFHCLPDSHWGHGYIGESGRPVGNLVLDDYIQEHGIRRVAFLKVDVEGLESRVLRGAQKALRSGVVSAGFIEIAPAALHRAGASAGQLLEALRRWGFDVYSAGLARSGSVGDDRRWAQVEINGELLRFASPSPVFEDRVQGDVLIVHESSPLAAVVREAVRALPVERPRRHLGPRPGAPREVGLPGR